MCGEGLKIRESPKTGVFTPGVVENACATPGDLAATVALGNPKIQIIKIINYYTKTLKANKKEIKLHQKYFLRNFVIKCVIR